MRISRKTKTNKSVFKYLSISYINVGLNVLINLLLINNLSSYNFGRISIGKTIFQTFDFAHIGIRNGLDRLLPDKHEEEEINEYFTVGLSTTLFVSFFFFIFWNIYKSSSILFYIFFTLSGIFYSVITLYRIYYRSKNNKGNFVRISFYSILFPSLIELFGFILFGIKGYIIGFLFAYIIVIIIIYKKFHVNLIIYKERYITVLKKILDKGWLLFLTSLVAFFSTSADRFLIEYYWGLEAVGRFSVIMFIFSVLAMFPVNYTEMIMSNIIKLKSFKYVFRHAILIAGFIFILVVLVYFLLPFLVQVFMKQYINDIHFMKIILLAIIPYSMRSVFYYYMHAIDKRVILFIIDLITTIAYIIGLMFILTKTNNLEYILYLKIGFYTVTILFTLFFALFYSKRIRKNHINCS